MIIDWRKIFHPVQNRCFGRSIFPVCFPNGIKQHPLVKPECYA